MSIITQEPAGLACEALERFLSRREQPRKRHDHDDSKHLVRLVRQLRREALQSPPPARVHFCESDAQPRGSAHTAPAGASAHAGQSADQVDRALQEERDALLEEFCSCHECDCT